MNLREIEKNCGYTFKNIGLLKKALTLSSYDGDDNNESLECLGDALLTFIVAEKYYLSGDNEGEITERKQALLSDDALRPVSVRLGLDEALLRGKGDTHNEKAVPSAYEALTAAIYLDGGLDAARTFALSTLTPLPQAVNFIGELQELLQGEGKPLPEYVSIDVGTPQKPRRKVTVKVGELSFSSESVNGQTAKREAAKLAYEYLTKK